MSPSIVVSPMTLLLLTILALFLVSVTSTPLTTSSTGSAGGDVVTVGEVTVITNFSFTVKNDAIGCLTSSPSTATAFAASNGGSIFRWSLKDQPKSVSPIYTVGTGMTAAFWACQINPAGTVLYLLDTRGLKLWSYNVNSPVSVPVLVGSFPNEPVGAPVSLAIDFPSSIAYVGTRFTDTLYAVNITAGTIYASYQMTTDVTALALSPDARTLYYGVLAIPQMVEGGISSVDVKAGIVPNPQSPTVLYSSSTIVDPTSIITANASLLFTDGGPLGGHDQGFPGQRYTQAIYALTTQNTTTSSAGTLTTLLSTTTVNLPSGLVLSSNQSELYFATSDTFSALTLAATEMPTTSTGSPPVTSTAAATTAGVSTRTPSPPIGGTASVGMSGSSAPLSAVTSWVAVLCIAAVAALL